MRTAAAKRSRRQLVQMAILCALIAVGVLLAYSLGAPIQRFAWDVIDRIIVAQPTHDLDDFVFVAIDDQSMKMDHLWPEDIGDNAALLAMQEGWPWPRNVYADAIERLLQAGARNVLLDLILDAERPGDSALRATLDRHPDQIVLGSNITPDPIPGLVPALEAVRMPAASLIDDGPNDPRVGFVNFWPGIGDVVRTIIYRTRRGVDHAQAQESFSLSTRALTQLGLEDKIPLDDRARYFRFGNLNTLQVVPFYSLFVEHDWETVCDSGKVFDGRTVVIGPSAAILQDFHLTPLGNIPGPLLHLNALAATMKGAYYYPIAHSITALLVFLAAATAWLINWRFRQPIVAITLLVVVAAAYYAATFGLAYATAQVLEFVQPTAALLISGFACIAWNFAASRRESTRMRSTLERYVSRNVVREILDHRDDFLTSLGGTRRPMTVFFSDVRGFTSFSESSDATEVVAQLNEYLAEMVRIIFEHEGTVDKFMGDGIMAVWGNVVSQGAGTDARKAASAAYAMRAALDKLNAEWSHRRRPEFSIGIGLHHGDAVFGNIGSSEKMEPTVIGDAVNLASRVEGLTKKYGVTNCVTGSCADLIRDDFRFRTVDLVQVVGKTKPVEIFTLLTPHTDPAPKWLSPWEEAIQLFRSRSFAEAASQFRALEFNSPDKLRDIYVARCEAFLKAPPPADWTGTEIATSK